MAETQTTGSGSLVEELLAQGNVKTTDLGYDLTRTGISTFINELVEQQRIEEKVTAALVDDMIRQLDDKLSKQVDAILHHEDFQKLESAWRGLKFLINRTNFHENIRINMLSVGKDELISDFSDAPELTKSGLYKIVYTSEYGQFGGQPYGAIIGDYAFSAGPQDVQLLRDLAAVASMSQSPFIGGTSPQFFGVESFSDLPNLKDLQAIFEMPQYAKWKGFRESEDARYVGLTLPRFILRLPYGPSTVPVKSFFYQESVDGKDSNFLWGNAVYAFASRLTDSFAKFRWCANIIGPQGGGAVDNLPVYNYEAMGAIQTKIPTEVLLSDRREFELAEQGFIALTMRKNSDNASFFSANSAQQPKIFPDTPEGKEAETNFRLSTQLPYMFIATRLAHYIKVLQRENIGNWKERSDLERELNNWLSQYVVDMENPVAAVRSRKPLRAASVAVEEVPGEPGWYRSTMKVRPHFKFMGAHFTLSLVGKLEKA